MDPVQNPFSPGAGTPPPELAGRGELLEEARIMIGRALNGRSTQGMLMTGLRGVGKTVILNELMRMAEEQGALSLFVEATAESTLSELLASELKKLFFSLNRIAGTAEKVKKGLVVLRNFIGAVHLKVGDIGLDIEPFAGIADSGNIETDLADLFECVAEAAKEKKKAVLLLVDEVQIFHNSLLGAVRSLEVTPDSFVMEVETTDPALYAAIEDVRDKMQKTLDLCADVVQARSDCRIYQKRIDLRRI